MEGDARTLKESWRRAKNFKCSVVLISNTGRVSIDGEIVTAPINSSLGYRYIKGKPVHQLVMSCFSKPKPGKSFVVDHRDGNKLNNHILNLEWVTIKENTTRGIILKKLSSPNLKNFLVKNITPNLYMKIIKTCSSSSDDINSLLLKALEEYFKAVKISELEKINPVELLLPVSTCNISEVEEEFEDMIEEA